MTDRDARNHDQQDEHENRPSKVEQLLSDQVPPADAETALAIHRADIHHRDPGQPRDFIDRLVSGD